MVKVHYVGKRMYQDQFVNFFNYEIIIQNTGVEAVQLLRRHWEIKDALNFIEHVIGEGVVGEMPYLESKQFFKYTSSVFIYGEIGNMQGYYTFVNSNTTEIFQVKIPLFKLTIPSIFN